MPKVGSVEKGKRDSLARDLVRFYDDLSEINACNAFILQALAGALVKGDGLDERSATGAMFCTQWLVDRSAELEERLKEIKAIVTGSADKGN